MSRKIGKIGIAVSFALVFMLSSGAWAISLDDAITGKPGSSFQLKLRLDNLANVKDILTHPLIALYSAYLKEEKTAGVMYALDLAWGLQPKSIMFVVGNDGGQQFLQMAVSMPETVLPQLNSIELGITTKTELTAFLKGENREPEKLDPVVSEGINGPYYLFRDTVFLAARENLLLIALSLEDLTASLDALDRAGVRRFVFMEYLVKKFVC